MKVWVVKQGRYRRRIVYVDGKKMYYARYLMEQNLGRKLEDGEVVHHIDGNTLNDNEENLSLVKQGEHCALHNFQRICTQESKDKMSRARKGRFIDAEWRMNMRVAKIGGKNHQYKPIDMEGVIACLNEGMKKKEIAVMFGICKNTLYNKLVVQGGMGR